MSRPPAARPLAGPPTLDVELLAETAASLGHAGRRVAETLAALAACAGPDDARRARLAEAAEAVYHYFIQRELCGFRRHDDAIAEYRIPPAVLARLGAV